MVLIPYITTYSCVRLCSGVYFFSVVELVFTTLDILASLCSAVDEHCQIKPTRRVIMISPVAVLPNTLHSYAVMCSCCSRILCIQPTNSITLKGSMRDKVPSPLPLQTLSSEIITEPFNAVWWAASRSASCRLHRQRKSTFRNCDFKVLHPRQLSDGIKQDWKPNKCLEETGSSCSEGHRF